VNSDQITVFTKVNSLKDVTDSHPNVVTKKGDRSVPVLLLNAFDKPFDTTTPVTAFLRDIDRSEMLYEATFKKVDTSWKNSAIAGTAVSAACAATTNASGRVTGFSPFYCEDATKMGGAGFLGDPAKSMKAGATSTKGWLLKIDTCVDGDANGVCDNATVTSRTKQLSLDKVTDMAAYVTFLGTFATNFEFTITQAANALTITPKAGYLIRLNVESDLGLLGMDQLIHVVDPITRTDAAAVAFATANDDNTNIDMVGGVANFKTRAGYVKYLDSIAAAPAAALPPTTPTAAPVFPYTAYTAATATDPAIYEVKGSTPITFTGVSQNNPNITYQWSYSDGVTVPAGISAARTFSRQVNLSATLRATNTETKETTTTMVVVKVGFPGLTTITAVPGAGRKVALTLAAIPAHTSVRVEWGDGSVNNYTTSVTPYTTPVHTYYNTNLSTTVKVRVFSGTLQIDEQTATIALPDTAKPVIGTFTLGAVTPKTLVVGPIVAITAITATDNSDVAAIVGPPAVPAVSGVVGYLVTETSGAPAAASITSATAPASYTFALTATGAKTLYAWVKDGSNNVSLAKTATVTLP
jgi:hypothetical protein